MEIMDIVAQLIPLLVAVVTGIIALIKHIKAGRAEQARAEAEKVTDALMDGIDHLKREIPAEKRKPIMKDVGSKLGDLKVKVDRRLADLGLNAKA